MFFCYSDNNHKLYRLWLRAEHQGNLLFFNLLDNENRGCWNIVLKDNKSKEVVGNFSLKGLTEDESSSIQPGTYGLQNSIAEDDETTHTQKEFQNTLSIFQKMDSLNLTLKGKF